MRRLAFLLIALVLAGAADAQAPRRVALVIANGAYANTTPLANPANDSRIVAAALARAGFQTVDARRDLGIGAFQRALRDFQARADGAQVALVYYAGHGIEANGKNWLIPIDATLNADRDLAYEAIDLNLVLDTVVGAQMRVVILDACRNNPFGRTWRRAGVTRAVARGLSGVEVDDVLVLYAAAPGQTAADGSGANSPFASALARRLPEVDLPIQLLGGAVRDDVLAATDGAQRPFISASITGTPFYLMPRSAPAVVAPTQPGATAPTAPPPAAWTQNARSGAKGRDCPTCPTLVVVPAGAFTMGSANGDPDERPPTRVTITRPFAIGVYEVTFAEYDACNADKACGRRPSDMGWGRLNYPVINVSYGDAQLYAAWLSRKTGQRYRIPSEAEWEYAARAGSTGDFGIGPTLSTANANIARSVGGGRTSQVGRYPANPWGIHDMHGNVAEWVANCLTADYAGGRTAASDTQACGSQQVIRGGSWNISEPPRHRSADRNAAPPAARDDTIGFRVLREL